MSQRSNSDERDDPLSFSALFSGEENDADAILDSDVEDDEASDVEDDVTDEQQLNWATFCRLCDLKKVGTAFEFAQGCDIRLVPGGLGGAAAGEEALKDLQCGVCYEVVQDAVMYGLGRGGFFVQLLCLL